MTNLFVISSNDIDTVLEGRVVSDTQRDAIYHAVSHMDSSFVFDQIDDIIQFELTPYISFQCD